MIRIYIEKLIRGENLTADEITSSLDEMLLNASEAQVAAFLALLRAKGETTAEITALVSALTEKMKKVELSFPVLDIVGTGGDGHNTVNISTGSALLAASCGVKVAKHGNRSVSSMSGSADLLEKLGLNIELSAEKVRRSIEVFNFGFCFAPSFHPAFGTIRHIRKNLAIPTVFNRIGPLLNPAMAGYLMVGVASGSDLLPTAEVLLQLNTERALVFHCKGLDEVCTAGPVNVAEICNGRLKEYVIDPADYGFTYCSIDDLRGGTPEFNANIIQQALAGKTGPIADTLILNAGLAHYIYGLSATIDQGITYARNAQEQGEAAALIEKIKADQSISQHSEPPYA